GHGGIGVLRRPAALARLLEQSLVVLLRGLEPVWTDDRRARVVAVAVTPRGGGRPRLADQPGAERAPLLLDTGRTIAAEVAWIAPQCPILVKVLGREQIHRQGLDARRCGAVLRRADERS